MHAGLGIYTYGSIACAAPAARDSHSSVDGESATSSEGDDAMAPFMFLHGVGMGVLPYINFVQRLAATGRCVCWSGPEYVALVLG